MKSTSSLKNLCSCMFLQEHTVVQPDSLKVCQDLVAFSPPSFSAPRPLMFQVKSRSTIGSSGSAAQFVGVMAAGGALPARLPERENARKAARPGRGQVPAEEFLNSSSEAPQSLEGWEHFPWAAQLSKPDLEGSCCCPTTCLQRGGEYWRSSKAPGVPAKLMGPCVRGPADLGPMSAGIGCLSP